MGQRLKGLASEVSQVLEIAPSQLPQITALLDGVLALLHQVACEHDSKKVDGFRFLTTEFVPNAKNSLTTDNYARKNFNIRRTLWEQSRSVLEMLRRICASDGSIPDSISSWHRQLVRNIQIAEEESIFDEVRSQVSAHKMRLSLSMQNEDRTPTCPNSLKFEKDAVCIRGFESGCAVETLRDDSTVSSESESKCRRRPSWAYYVRTMKTRDEQFLEYLAGRTTKRRRLVPSGPFVESPDFEFVSLRRWNSFSPNLGSRATRTVGGGYFLRAYSKHSGSSVGIVVDPGYNFLENLFNEGYTIADIDVVSLTHSDPDHTENLTNLLTLVHERKKRLRRKMENAPADIQIRHSVEHKPILVMNDGVFEQYQVLLNSLRDSIREVIVLAHEGSKRAGDACRRKVGLRINGEGLLCDLEQNTWNGEGQDEEPTSSAVNRPLISLRAGPAWHDDRTGRDSIGLLFEYWDGGTNSTKIGIVGDTCYHPSLKEKYQDCDVVVAHIGSLVSHEIYSGEQTSVEAVSSAPCPEEHRKTLRGENHLYLPGVNRLICELIADDTIPLLVLSEFGEELRGGLRTDIARRISDVMLRGRNSVVVPADVGLRIDIAEKRLLCCACHNYLDSKGMTALTVLPDVEAIAYVCEDCMAARRDEVPRIVSEWCTTVRPLTAGRN